ncbi:hypothetical protein J8J27_25615, partial [Mycobacterium tuberculosis]|nr:hypothetical protein [Mycobacterium tuberculosis]
VLVCVQSFNDVPQATAAGFRGFTLKWYAAVFFTGTYADAFWVSVQLALTAMAIAIVLALPAAFSLARTPFRGRSALAPAPAAERRTGAVPGTCDECRA